mmetsp:Transcript_65012/g.105354  ORF Transcript_65012/g.105354 Transcript_65012/m.105354 type:complete len:227 (+) Transcript_65012:304-984(+)
MCSISNVYRRVRKDLAALSEDLVEHILANGRDGLGALRSRGLEVSGPRRVGLAREHLRGGRQHTEGQGVHRHHKVCRSGAHGGGLALRHSSHDRRGERVRGSSNRPSNGMRIGVDDGETTTIARATGVAIGHGEAVAGVDSALGVGVSAELRGIAIGRSRQRSGAVYLRALAHAVATTVARARVRISDAPAVIASVGRVSNDAIAVRELCAGELRHVEHDRKHFLD